MKNQSNGAQAFAGQAVADQAFPGQEVSSVDSAGVSHDVVVLAPSAVAGSPARRARGERGMVTAEWAVGIIAAIALAGVLIAVVTNGAVEDALLKIVLGIINTITDHF